MSFFDLFPEAEWGVNMVYFDFARFRSQILLFCSILFSFHSNWRQIVYAGHGPFSWWPAGLYVLYMWISTYIYVCTMCYCLPILRFLYREIKQRSDSQCKSGFGDSRASQICAFETRLKYEMHRLPFRLFSESLNTHYKAHIHFLA